MQPYIEVSSIFIFEMASALQRSALAILPSIHSILASPARAFSSSSDMAVGGRYRALSRAAAAAQRCDLALH